MKKYVYHCPKCGIMGSANQDNPYDYQVCNNCGAAMHYIGVTKEEWDEKTNDEKEEIKKDLARIDSPEGGALEDGDKPKANIRDTGKDEIIIRLLDKQSKDVEIIKNILIFYLVVFLFGLFIWFMYFLR